MENAKHKLTERKVVRRKSDRAILYQNERLNQLYKVGQIITSEMNLDSLFEVIIEQTNEIIGTERSTVFLYDATQDVLWSLVATGMGKNKIRVPSDSGIAGLTFLSNKPLRINDAYSDSRFNIEIDKRSGFRTRNILCIPVLNRKKECIGVIEALNKVEGDFVDKDLEILSSIADYVAIALENAKLYEDIKKYSNRLEQTLFQIEKLEYVKSQLTKFVPSSVSKLVEQNPDPATLEKVTMEVTILFIDIQGFSSITENYDPRIVNDMVENHFSKYLDCITRHQGEVNETSGDGLMVIFKENTRDHHAKAAVIAALEISAENQRLNDDYSYPWGNVDLHVGINTGEALVGFTKMKSLAGERYTYTASGLTTVLASRIGSLSSETRLYVGIDTFNCVEKFCEYEYMGEKKVKNIEEPIRIYWIKRINL
ncbi:MAG: adenylate/guanylate cyclase domain-containing protein [Desulfobacterales bacterium]|jgi:class 3 adenylate cyclase/putative methionine-R-sulfoxide reductase with GAF domain